MTAYAGQNCLSMPAPLLLGMLARARAMKLLPEGMEIARAMPEDWFTTDRHESWAWLEVRRRVGR